MSVFSCRMNMLSIDIVCVFMYNKIKWFGSLNWAGPFFLSRGYRNLLIIVYNIPSKHNVPLQIHQVQPITRELIALHFATTIWNDMNFELARHSKTTTTKRSTRKDMTHDKLCCVILCIFTSFGNSILIAVTKL